MCIRDSFPSVALAWRINEENFLKNVDAMSFRISALFRDVYKRQVLRAGLESIAYQVKDLIDMMTRQAGIELKALRVDGGPTKNQLDVYKRQSLFHQ